jgi:hypothetical protein
MEILWIKAALRNETNMSWLHCQWY